MNMNDFYNTGSDILDAVNDAVSRNDFTDLKKQYERSQRRSRETSGNTARQTQEKISDEGLTAVHADKAERPIRAIPTAAIRQPKPPATASG